MQPPILRQQRGTYIQQFIEDFDVGNPRMLGCQKYKLYRLFPPSAGGAAPRVGFLANAFVNDDSFDAIRERTRGSPGPSHHAGPSYPSMFSSLRYCVFGSLYPAEP